MRDQLDLPARPPLFLADLTAPGQTWERVAGWLAAGAAAARHPFHWPAVVTAAAGGPTARVVVLRRFDPAARQVVFHTDVRSPKAAELRRDRRCGLLFYDPDTRLQLRLDTTAAVHHADAVARVEFDALPAHTRATYAGRHAPGEELPPDAPFDYPPKPPADDAAAFRNFAAVVCAIDAADALELHEDGHRRAKLWWPNGEVAMRRVAP